MGGRKLSFSRGDLILLILAILMVGYGGYDYVQQQNAIKGAVAVNATITDVGVEQTGGRGIDYVSVVSYEYQFEGTAYTSGDVFPWARNLSWGGYAGLVGILTDVAALIFSLLLTR